MAKAKKASVTPTHPQASEPAGPPQAKTGKRPPTRKPPAKKAEMAKPPAPATPLIDTSLAAQAAAKMVAHRDVLAAAGGASADTAGRESSTFKQLKQGLNKPASQGPASFLQNTAPQKKLNLPFAGRNQVGRNQTFGADVNRTGVPRRTPG